ncbi:sterile alpha motif domain-containing protein 7 [Sorex araneus]|uniref:sterile alpha motif domain-containing protein 7 n=1 Tax=Sorex araneus TaxID=42254 RepID=UPI002433C923|nr:sterile alpha motif domain-containing protein 7 [Sorex araneus]
MAMNPLMTVSGQQKIPLVPSPFEPPSADRDLLLSTTAVPTDPRQFCFPSPFGSSVSQNANVPNVLASRIYSGWGVLPPESLKAMTRRNEMIERQHTARMEMEMHAIYQKRRTEKVNSKRIGGLGLPLFYGSSIPAGPAVYPCRSMMLPTSDLHFPRSALRNLQGNPVLAASGPNYLESWGQKCRRLRKGTGNQKVLYGDSQSSKSQAEDSLFDQAHANPHEENEYAKGIELEILNNQKSNEVNEKSTVPCVNTCGKPESSHRNPWGPRDALLEAKAWTCGKDRVPEQILATCSERSEICPPGPSSLPGTHAPVTISANLSLDEDIQKWTASDVYDFISGLPGCSDYAQVFKDHAIDGETLPLLTEEHLRSIMGLKLGPALKIQSQVSQHVESMLYRKSRSHPTHTKQKFDQTVDSSPLLDFNAWSDTLDLPCSQDIIVPKGTEQDSVRN